MKDKLNEKWNRMLEDITDEKMFARRELAKKSQKVGYELGDTIFKQHQNEIQDELAQMRQKYGDAFDGMMNEMPAWNDSNKDLSDDSEIYYGGRTLAAVARNKKSRGYENVDIFKVGPYSCYVWKSQHSMVQVDVFDGSEKIGDFVWGASNGYYSTESVAVLAPYQGRGIGFGVYKHMIENHFTTLYSDTSLTGETGKGSFDLWVKLGKVFPYKYIYDSTEDIAEEVDGFTRDMMHNENTRFVVSTEDILE